MKNFTNNFKQFTSRLSARWLIMALMLLVGTGSAWAASSLMGSDFPNGNWDGGIGLPCTLYLESKTYNFKVKENGTWYEDQNEGTMSPGDSWTFYNYGKGNTKLNITTAGYYTLSWNESTNTFSVVEAIATAYVVGGYYGGNDKNYTSGKKLTKQSDGTYSGTFSDFSGSCYFQIYDDIGRVWGCDYVKKNVGESVTLNTSKDNKVEYSLTNGISYIFSFSPSDGTFSVQTSCIAPTKDHFTYTAPANLDYNGSAKAATVAWKQGTGTGNITIYYKSTSGSYTTTAPSAAGAYTVAVKTVADGNYCATDDYVEVGSFTITCLQPAVSNFTYTAPANLVYNGSAKTAIVTWKSGTGTGTITKYYKSGSGSYGTTAPTNVGTYTVAVKTAAGGNYCATDDYVEVGTFAIICAQPTASNFTYTAPANLVYNGSAKTATVTWKTGTGTGAITKYYKSGSGSYNTTVPTNVGTYTVAVKTVAGGNYCATEDYVQVGTFTITCAKPIADNFSYTAPNNLVYNGQAKSATVAWKQGTGTGNITIYYKSTSGSYTTTAPSAAGAYTVAVKTVADGNYCATDDYVQVGTFTITCPAPSAPTVKVIEEEIITCNGNNSQLGRIQITNYNPDYEYKIGVNNDPLPAASIEAGGYINISFAGTFTLYAINECGSETPATTSFTIKQTNNTPTISGATFTQPGKENAIELTVPTGNDTKWTVNKNGDLSVATGSSTMFSAENEDTYTIEADYNGCTDTHDVTVSDAFYIWVRNAKEGETAYGNFYYHNENSEAVRGGEMFYAECDNLPTNGNTLLDTHYINYNKGGRKADLVKDDCDGYTWYGFQVSADVIAGTKYFYVHATNDLGDGGFYTHTVPTKVINMTGDVYYTLCETNVNDCNEGSKGWKIVPASAPYAGPKVYASGATTLGANQFAALYVTDCSGKEIDTYQWQSSSTQNGTYTDYAASVTNSGTLYSGDAGTTNNIRPATDGWYRCKVTYKDHSTLTSEPVQVTGSYTHASSTLPVIIVNTNGVGFPVNDCSGTPSKNADKMKEKVSVDVKIYKAGTMVYDRKARMNYRGSSSLNFLKKSYAFCPGKDNCVEDKGRQDYVKTEKMNMLNVGTAKDKDWVLYAAAPDPSLMRNRLVFDTFRDMTGKWSVNSCYVQLYVDGTYKGIYVLMDKITNNKDRVNITDENGFIVKFDKTDKVDRVGGYEGKLGDEKTFKTTRTGKDDIGTYDTSIDQRFEIEYPEKDDYPSGWSAKVNQIQGMFEAFENALAQGDFATVQKYIDYDSWADWFIISEYIKNVDAYRASNIFVYNGNKIEAWPLWDQELSLNNQTNVAHGSNSTTGLMATTASIYNNGARDFPAPFWFTGGAANITGGLLSDPCFVQVVKEKWNQYSTGTGALTQDALNAKIEAYTTELGTAADISFNRGTMDCGSCNTGCGWDGTGYNNTINKSTSITNLNTWITNRGNNLTTALNNLTGASFSIQILPSEVVTTPWEPVEIAVSVTPEGYDYTLEYTGEHKLGDIANAIIEEEGDKITYRIPRPDDWGTGDESVEGKRTDIEYGIKATLNVQDGTTVCGSQAAPSSTGKIILQDEDNEKCAQPQLEP